MIEFSVSTIVIPITLLLKFTLPVFLLFFPFFASWANFILDTIDGDILMYYGVELNTYQMLDKSADYVTYIFMLIAGYRWRVRKTILAMFLLRSVGQILFFVTGNDYYLFLFPNFLEPLFMIYAFILHKLKDQEKAFLYYRKNIGWIWLIVVLYKYWNEYNIHIARIDLSERLFGIGS